MTQSILKEHYQNVRQRIEEACHKAGRGVEEVELLAVSKFHSLEAVMELADLGQCYFGENYIQEALQKQAGFESERGKNRICWDMIGHIQSRKASLAAGNFRIIHTLDSLKLAKALEKRLVEIDRDQDALLEINIAGEPQKSGVSIEASEKLAADILENAPHIRLRGLMCMPPFTATGEAARPYFIKLRNLRDRLELFIGRKLPVLSMGMSSDFEIAIEEGAAIVRVGSAIFGPRPAKNS